MNPILLVAVLLAQQPVKPPPHNPYTYWEDRAAYEKMKAAEEATQKAIEAARPKESEPAPEPIPEPESAPVGPQSLDHLVYRGPEPEGSPAEGMAVLFGFVVGWVIVTAPCWILGAMIAGRRQAGNEGAMLGLFLGPFGVLMAFFLDKREKCPACASRLNQGALICASCRTPVAQTGPPPIP